MKDRDIKIKELSELISSELITKNQVTIRIKKNPYDVYVIYNMKNFYKVVNIYDNTEKKIISIDEFITFIKECNNEEFYIVMKNTDNYIQEKMKLHENCVVKCRGEHNCKKCEKLYKKYFLNKGWVKNWK